MFRLILILLAIVASFNVNASYQSSSSKHQKEFVLIQDRFEKVKPLIVKVAKEQGVHPEIMTTTIYRESRFNPKIGKNKKSSAHSLVQMTMPTKRAMLKRYGSQLGLPKNADLNNPKYAVTLAAAYFNYIEDHLTTQLKRKPTNAEIALGYRFGEGAATTMIKKKSSVGKRWMASYRKDAAFYGAKVATPKEVKPHQLAFAKTQYAAQVAELQSIWNTLYTKLTPATNLQLASNEILKGAIF